MKARGGRTIQTNKVRGNGWGRGKKRGKDRKGRDEQERKKEEIIEDNDSKEKIGEGENPTSRTRQAYTG